MNEFHYRGGELHAEDVPVAQLAERYDTPLYVYSRAHLRRQYRGLAEAMREVSPRICYAVKANTNAAVIRTLALEGAGADVVSGGELYRARNAGIEASRIVFAGVGKTDEEIAYGIEEDILFFTVESEAELDRISACARRAGRTARVCIRVNPGVDPRTHKYTSTGKMESKFGVDLQRAERAYEQAGRLPNVEIAGLHMHLGSPLMSVDPYAEALDKVEPLVRALAARYPAFRYLDVGGGLGIPYQASDRPPSSEEFAAAVVPRIRRLGLETVMEPGRFLVGNAGILVTRVEYVKDNPFKKFVIVDAAMNDLIRPPLYQAYHEILPVRQTERTIFGDVVGPVCETGDFLAADRELPEAAEGDLLAVMSAGAYGFVMASNYNSRGKAAEVMVSGARSELIRQRESWDDLLRGEHMPAWE